MLIKNLEETLDDLHEIDGIEACILYRIDGIPIAVRTSKDNSMLNIMFWLEKQISDVLRNMNKEVLKATTFDFRNYQVIIIPSSRSTVLVTIINADANPQLISIEIARAKSLINRYVS